MAKNKDSKSVNRTGKFNFETMTIKFEDKNNSIQVFDLKSLLKEYDEEDISITIASDFAPSHLAEQE